MGSPTVSLGFPPFLVAPPVVKQAQETAFRARSFGGKAAAKNGPKSRFWHGNCSKRAASALINPHTGLRKRPD